MNYTIVTNNVITTAVKSIEQIGECSPGKTVSITCIALPNELIFIDCGWDEKFIKKFRQRMESHFNRKITYLLLTHGHWDHADAIDIFRDVEVVIAEKGVSRIKRSPDIIVKDKFLFELDDHKIIFQVTGGHSIDSAYILYETKKILLTGDNLLTCFAQVFLNGKALLDVYRYWETLDVDYVIPGHGYIVNKNYISDVRMYFENLITVLSKLKRENKFSITEILDYPNLPKYCYSNHSKWEERGRYHTGWLNQGINYWYEEV